MQVGKTGFLAVFLVVSVILVRYFSIRNLLERVENITKPSENLWEANGLMSDGYLLDISRERRMTDKDLVFSRALERINTRLELLRPEFKSTVRNGKF